MNILKSIVTWTVKLFENSPLFSRQPMTARERRIAEMAGFW